MKILLMLYGCHTTKIPDAPGTIYHIIVRGIDRRKLFVDDTDRNNFLDRIVGIIKVV